MAAFARSPSTSTLPAPQKRLNSSRPYQGKRSQGQWSSTTSIHSGPYSERVDPLGYLHSSHASSQNKSQVQVDYLLLNADADLKTYGMSELRDGFFDATYSRPLPRNRPEMMKKALETLPLALQTHHPLSFKYFLPHQWKEFKEFCRQITTTRSGVRLFKSFLSFFVAYVVSLVPHSRHWLGRYSHILVLSVLLNHAGRPLGSQIDGAILTISGTVAGLAWGSLALWVSTSTSIAQRGYDTDLFNVPFDARDEGSYDKAGTAQTRLRAENKTPLASLPDILALVAKRLAFPTTALLQAMMACTTSCDDTLIVLGGHSQSLRPSYAPQDLSVSLRTLSTAITTFEAADLALMNDPKFPSAASTYRQVVALFLFVHPVRQAADKVRTLSEKILDMQQRHRGWTLQLPSYPLHKQFNRTNAQVRHDRGGLTAGFYFRTKVQLERTMGDLQSRPFVPSYRQDDVLTLRNTSARTWTSEQKTFCYKVWGVLHGMQGFEARFALKVVLVTTLLSVPAWLEQSRDSWNRYQIWWTVITVWLMTHPRVSGTFQDLAARLLCVVLGAVWGGLAYATGGGNPYVMAVFAAVFMIPMMHRYTQSAHPRSGLMGCISFTVISLSALADEGRMPAITIAWTRGLAFAVAIFASILTNWIMWPFVARHELKKSLATMMLHLAILYRRVVSKYIYYAEEQAPTARDIERSEMLEGRLREGFVRIRQLLELTQHEIRLRAPFDPLPYSALAEACERFFEHLVQVRQSSLYFRPSLRVSTREANDSLIPYRRDAVAVILMNLYILASALRADQPVPRYMPSAVAARKKLIDRMEELEVKHMKQDKPIVREGRRWADVYRYAFASALTDIVEQLQQLQRYTKEILAFHFVAGLGTGILSASLLQPIDLLKTRVQQARSISLLHTFRDITRGPDSLRQLWRGTLPSVIRTGFGSALYFSTLNALRQHVSQSNLLTSTGVVSVSKTTQRSSSSSSLPQLSNLANLTTGAIARASAGLVMMPITVIKVRYESNLYSYQSLFAAGSSILQQEGIKGFFAGFGATAIRDAPYAGLYVVFYEQSKRYLSKIKEVTAADETLPNDMRSCSAISINFVSGVLAAGVATAITNPFDAVKTRLQLMPGKYANMVQASRQMIKEEGVRTLFDGLGLRAGRKTLSSALGWTVYEELVRRAETKWAEAD
ncbi:MAG: hypothetical protein Q9213_005325 [Squamulea squamosa]